MSFLSLVLLALAAGAPPVYRCDRVDEIVFQQSPCAANDEPLALRPESSFGEPQITADPRPQPGATPQRSNGRTKQPTAVRTPKQRTTGSPRDANASAGSTACETARAKREAAYTERGNRMGFDERRALQDRLDAACGLR